MMNAMLSLGMPISASMFYGQPVPPTNASATPEVYDVTFSDLEMWMPTVATENHKESGLSFQFLGLPESVMRDFEFTRIKTHGTTNGWQCKNTSGFRFFGVQPMPSQDSGCI